MNQKAVMHHQLGTNGLRTRKMLAFTSRHPTPRKQNFVVRAANEKEEKSLDVSAAFLLSLSGMLATAPSVLAAAAGSTTATAPIVPRASSALSAKVPEAAIDQAVQSIIDAVKAAGGVVKSGVDIAADGAGQVKGVADQVYPYVKRGADIVAPYAKAGANIATEVAKPVVRATGPVVQNGINEVEQFLAKQGLNPQAIYSQTKEVGNKANEAITYATPTVKSATSQIAVSTPQQLLQYGAALLGVYFFGPTILKGVFGSFRGYAGQISPAAALDAAANDGNVVIIDIRSANEKEYTGVPDIPYNNRLIELEYANVSNRKIRGQLRNVNDIEKQITVLQIASLKKVKKRTRILLLDKNGGVSKDVAKALAARGYRKVFVITNGFNGWNSSKLQTKGSSSVSSVEILGPLFGSGRSDRRTTSSRQKALPSGR